MKAIVCVSKNWGIGYMNKLLFHIKEDMQFFKFHTYGNVVVMGKNTFNSLPGGKPLPGRTNVILSSTLPEREDAIVVRDKKSLKKLIDDFESEGKEVYIIGGEKIYNQFINQCSKVYITVVDKEMEADKFFPKIYLGKKWKKVFDYEFRNKENDCTVNIITYINIEKSKV